MSGLIDPTELSPLARATLDHAAAELHDGIDAERAERGPEPGYGGFSASERAAQ